MEDAVAVATPFTGKVSLELDRRALRPTNQIRDMQVAARDKVAELMQEREAIAAMRDVRIGEIRKSHDSRAEHFLTSIERHEQEIRALRATMDADALESAKRIAESETEFFAELATIDQMITAQEGLAASLSKDVTPVAKVSKKVAGTN